MYLFEKWVKIVTETAANEPEKLKLSRDIVEIIQKTKNGAQEVQIRQIFYFN